MKKKHIKKKFIFYSIIIVFLPIVVIIIAEVSLRLLGHHPASPKYRPNITVEPGGRYFKKDSLLGYTHLPGKLFVTLNDNYTFITTHKSNTLRITHPIAEDSNYVNKPKLWIMGGSDTHGWSINDEETYAWLIQEMYKDKFEIRNFGCSGYSTIHSLLKIMEELKNSKKPEIIVVAYSSVHDRRNAFLLRRRKAVTSWNFLGSLSQPYASYNEKEGLQIHKADTVKYKGLPFNEYSSLLNFIEKVYLYFDEKFSNSNEVTKAIFEKINNICQKNDIKLIIAGMENRDKTVEMLKYFNSKNFNTVDLSVDYNISENLNLPHDFHPSPVAHKKFAKKLGDFINEINN